MHGYRICIECGQEKQVEHFREHMRGERPIETCSRCEAEARRAHRLREKEEKDRRAAEEVKRMIEAEQASAGLRELVMNVVARFKTDKQHSGIQGFAAFYFEQMKAAAEKSPGSTGVLSSCRDLMRMAMAAQDGEDELSTADLSDEQIEQYLAQLALRPGLADKLSKRSNGTGLSQPN